MASSLVLLCARFWTLLHRLRLRAVCAFALVAVTACIRSGGPPSVTPSGTLSVDDGSRGGVRPFSVVFASPRGDAASASEISIVLSRPLRQLSLAADEPLPRVTLTPTLEGEWRWVGAMALLFVPKGGRLPGATQVKVEVPADLRALDGTRLGQPFEFSFTTPRPRLVRSTPSSGERGLEPNTHIDLRFNQPLDPRELERAALLQATHAGKSKVVSFRARQPDPQNPKRLVVEPAAPLPIHSTIQLTLSESLVGKEGPLPAAEPQSLAFETYGPLQGVDVTCNQDTPDQRCVPGGSLDLSLSNPVRLRDLKSAIATEPAVPLRWDSWSSDDDWTESVELVGKFEAGATYKITVAPGLRDRYGQAMAKPYAKTMRFGDFWPAVEIGVTGAFLEPSAPRAIPIGALNTPSYELVAARVPVEKLADLYARRDAAEKFAFMGSLAGAEKRTIQSRSAKNRVEQQSVDSAKLLGGPGGRGAIAIATRFTSGRDRRTAEHDVRLLQVTDLALSAKLSRHGSLVWVTRLSNGAPVPGATVEIRDAGKETKTYLTDANGLVRISERDFAPVLGDWEHVPTAIVVARLENDVSHRSVSEFIDPWRLRVPPSLPGGATTYGMVFTDRGLYRPGDVVQIKGIARRAGARGNEVLAARSFDVLLRSPEHDLVSRNHVTTTAFGTFAVTLKVPAAGALGSWAIETEGLPEGSLSQGFEVAEYRPTEFKVTAEPSRPAFVRKDQAEWKLRAEYLFGAPMVSAEARYTVTRMSTSFAPAGAEDFVTDAWTYHADLPEAALEGGSLQQNTIRLDARGGATVKQALELPGQRGPELVTADVEVMDVSRQTVATSVSTIVHPAEFYVGLKNPDRYFVDTPGTFSAQIATFAPGGARLGGKKVELDLIRRRWVLARQKAGDETHAVSTPVDKVVATCTVSTEAARLASCPLAVGESGYYLVRATAKDSKNNTTTAALSFYAVGQGGPSFADHDDLHLDLALDKKTYRPGDEARVLIKSPFSDAEALITVERAGVHRSERQTLRGPTPTITLPVTADMAPNAFVSVHLVRGRTAPPGEAVRAGVGGPTYRIGYAELRLDTSDRRLDVKVRPNKTDYRPGEPVTVDVSVHDAAGKPRKAEITLYAADEGVLSLIGYKTPDPLSVFTAAQPLAVATLETRDALAKIQLLDLTSLGQQKGLEGGGGGADGARRDFRQSIYFNPSLLTDDDGKARVTFKLGESLTTYRIMAVAVGLEDRYGSADARVTTSTRLMARPALPRFLRVGDRIEAGVVLSAKRFGPATITVRATAEGVRLAADAAKVVRIEKDGSAEVRFAFEAEKAGTATFRFTAVGGGEADSVQVERRIETPTALETVALYGHTEGESGERIGDLAGLRRDVGSLDVSLASTALVGLDGGMEQLVEYPYGCTEQLASRLLPLLSLASLAKDFSFALPTNANALVERTVGHIIQRQQGDGGFGTWPDSPESSPWVSAYALWVLHEASVRKAHVPKRVFDRGLDYLKRQLDGADRDATSLAAAAFVADVLAELRRPDAGHMNRLFERRERLPLFSRALLLHAYAIAKVDRNTVATLANDIENELVLGPDTASVRENVGDEYAVLMDSPTRSSAMVLRALLAARPDHPLAPKLARGLLAARSGGTWRSTQETAFALLALDAYRRAQEGQIPDFLARVWLGQKELTEARFSGRTARAHRATLPAARLDAAGDVLAFEKKGSGTLFYEARLSYARQTLPREPLDRGFFIQKTLRALTPEELPAAIRSGPQPGTETFTAGDLVLADLVIVAPGPRDYVVIEDPLPPGLEAVDARLATTARWMDIERMQAVDPGCPDCEEPEDDRLAKGTAFLESWHRRELRDDRVLHFVDHMAAGMYRYRYLARATTVGKFVLPPTRAEEMYAPEIFGRTGATALEVR